MIAEIFLIGLGARKYGVPPATIHYCKRAGRHINRTPAAVLQEDEILRAIASILLRTGRIGNGRHSKNLQVQESQRVEALRLFLFALCGFKTSGGPPRLNVPSQIPNATAWQAVKRWASFFPAVSLGRRARNVFFRAKFVLSHRF
jgi:hypothetical protein